MLSARLLNSRQVINAKLQGEVDASMSWWWWLLGECVEQGVLHGFTIFVMCFGADKHQGHDA